MTAVSGKFYGVGLKYARLYKLDSNGVPDATGTTGTAPYMGLLIGGAKTYNVTIAEARKIVHADGTRIRMLDSLPPVEASSATLETSRNDHDIHALLTNTLAAAVGESSVIGWGTDKQGEEPTVGMILCQQAKDALTGIRRWNSYFVSAAQAINKAASMNAEGAVYNWDIMPAPTQYALWGEKYTSVLHGYTEAQMLNPMTEGMPLVASWLGDGTITEFNFATGYEAKAAGKINKVMTVAADGTRTDATATVTKAVDGVTFTTAPASGVTVVCFYEY